MEPDLQSTVNAATRTLLTTAARPKRNFLQAFETDTSVLSTSSCQNFSLVFLLLFNHEVGVNNREFQSSTVPRHFTWVAEEGRGEGGNLKLLVLHLLRAVGRNCRGGGNLLKSGSGLRVWRLEGTDTSPTPRLVWELFEEEDPATSPIIGEHEINGSLQLALADVLRNLAQYMCNRQWPGSGPGDLGVPSFPSSLLFTEGHNCLPEVQRGSESTNGLCFDYLSLMFLCGSVVNGRVIRLRKLLSLVPEDPHHPSMTDRVSLDEAAHQLAFTSHDPTRAGSIERHVRAVFTAFPGALPDMALTSVWKGTNSLLSTALDSFQHIIKARLRAPKEDGGKDLPSAADPFAVAAVFFLVVTESPGATKRHWLVCQFCGDVVSSPPPHEDLQNSSSRSSNSSNSSNNGQGVRSSGPFPPHLAIPLSVADDHPNKATQLVGLEASTAAILLEEAAKYFLNFKAVLPAIAMQALTSTDATRLRMKKMKEEVMPPPFPSHEPSSIRNQMLWPPPNESVWQRYASGSSRTTDTMEGLLEATSHVRLRNWPSASNPPMLGSKTAYHLAGALLSGAIWRAHTNDGMRCIEALHSASVSRDLLCSPGDALKWEGPSKLHRERIGNKTICLPVTEGDSDERMIDDRVGECLALVAAVDPPVAPVIAEGSRWHSDEAFRENLGGLQEAMMRANGLESPPGWLSECSRGVTRTSADLLRWRSVWGEGSNPEVALIFRVRMGADTGGAGEYVVCQFIHLTRVLQFKEGVERGEEVYRQATAVSGMVRESEGGLRGCVLDLLRRAREQAAGWKKLGRSASDAQASDQRGSSDGLSLSPGGRGAQRSEMEGAWHVQPIAYLRPIPAESSQPPSPAASGRHNTSSAATSSCWAILTPQSLWRVAAVLLQASVVRVQQHHKGMMSLLRALEILVSRERTSELPEGIKRDHEIEPVTVDFRLPIQEWKVRDLPDPQKQHRVPAGLSVPPCASDHSGILTALVAGLHPPVAPIVLPPLASSSVFVKALGDLQRELSRANYIDEPPEETFKNTRTCGSGDVPWVPQIKGFPQVGVVYLVDKPESNKVQIVCQFTRLIRNAEQSLALGKEPESGPERNKKPDIRTYDYLSMDRPPGLPSLSSLEDWLEKWPELPSAFCQVITKATVIVQKFFKKPTEQQRASPLSSPPETTLFAPPLPDFRPKAATKSVPPRRTQGPGKGANAVPVAAYSALRPLKPPRARAVPIAAEGPGKGANAVPVAASYSALRPLGPPPARAVPVEGPGKGANALPVAASYSALGPPPARAVPVAAKAVPISAGPKGLSGPKSASVVQDPRGADPQQLSSIPQAKAVTNEKEIVAPPHKAPRLNGTAAAAVAVGASSPTGLSAFGPSASTTANGRQAPLPLLPAPTRLQPFFFPGLASAAAGGADSSPSASASSSSATAGSATQRAAAAAVSGGRGASSSAAAAAAASASSPSSSSASADPIAAANNAALLPLQPGRPQWLQDYLGDTLRTWDNMTVDEAITRRVDHIFGKPRSAGSPEACTYQSVPLMPPSPQVTGPVQGLVASALYKHQKKTGWKDTVWKCKICGKEQKGFHADLAALMFLIFEPLGNSENEAMQSVLMAQDSRDLERAVSSLMDSWLCYRCRFVTMDPFRHVVDVVCVGFLFSSFKHESLPRDNKKHTYLQKPQVPQEDCTYDPNLKRTLQFTLPDAAVSRIRQQGNLELRCIRLTTKPDSAVSRAHVWPLDTVVRNQDGLRPQEHHLKRQRLREEGKDGRLLNARMVREPQTRRDEPADCSPPFLGAGPGTERIMRTFSIEAFDSRYSYVFALVRVTEVPFERIYTRIVQEDKALSKPSQQMQLQALVAKSKSWIEGRVRTMLGGQQGGDEIQLNAALTSVPISIRNNVGEKMNMPFRGKNCIHVECCDLKEWLQMREKMRGGTALTRSKQGLVRHFTTGCRGTCDVMGCGRPLSLAEIEIDQFLQRTVLKDPMSSGFQKIQFCPRPDPDPQFSDEYEWALTDPLASTSTGLTEEQIEKIKKSKYPQASKQLLLETDPMTLEPDEDDDIAVMFQRLSIPTNLRVQQQIPQRPPPMRPLPPVPGVGAQMAAMNTFPVGLYPLQPPSYGMQVFGGQLQLPPYAQQVAQRGPPSQMFQAHAGRGQTAHMQRGRGGGGAGFGPQRPKQVPKAKGKAKAAGPRAMVGVPPPRGPQRPAPPRPPVQLAQVGGDAGEPIVIDD